MSQLIIKETKKRSIKKETQKMIEIIGKEQIWIEKQRLKQIGAITDFKKDRKGLKLFGMIRRRINMNRWIGINKY